MKVRWTAAASQDRADIRSFIATDNPNAAIRIDELFGEVAARLADFPQLGRAGRVPGTRELIPHRSYRLIYEIHKDAIVIMAVVHTSRQWPPRSH